MSHGLALVNFLESLMVLVFHFHDLFLLPNPSISPQFLVSNTTFLSLQHEPRQSQGPETRNTGLDSKIDQANLPHHLEKAKFAELSLPLGQ